MAIETREKDGVKEHRHASRNFWYPRDRVHTEDFGGESCEERMATATSRSQSIAAPTVTKTEFARKKAPVRRLEPIKVYYKITYPQDPLELFPFPLKPNPGDGEVEDSSVLHSSGCSLNPEQIISSRLFESLPD